MVMKINVISIFPEMFAAVTAYGMTRQAIARRVLELQVTNPRDYADDRHATVDARPYGGGPGMLLRPEPLARCIDVVQETNPGPVIYLTPQGTVLRQPRVAELAREPAIILLAGRYQGVDERVIESRVEYEVSIGDYVLAGGELPAMVLVDAIARLLPGVLGNEQSAQQNSFANGLLDCPHYTRPPCFEGRAVPPVLLSGDHAKIRAWRREQALARTRQRRPDLITRTSPLVSG